MRKPAILAAARAAAVLVTTGCATEPVASRKDISFDAAAPAPDPRPATPRPTACSRSCGTSSRRRRR